MAGGIMIFKERLRLLFVCWAVLETMLFGGLMNGWASLVFVLKEDGLYGDLCPADGDSNSSSGLPANNVSRQYIAICAQQDAMLNLWFSVAAGLRNIFGIVIGLVVFKFGTRVARLLGWFLFNGGALMMAFSDSSVPWLVLPSLLALSYGGGTLLLTNVQLSSLFPRASGIVVTLISGAVDFSATTQLVVKLLREVGIPRKSSYIGITLAHACMAMISTMVFLPKKMYMRRPSIFQFGPDGIDLQRLNEIARRARAISESDENKDDDNDTDPPEQAANSLPGLGSRRGCVEGMGGKQGQEVSTCNDQLSNEENRFHSGNSARQGQRSYDDVILDAQMLFKTVEARCLTSVEGGAKGSVDATKMFKDSAPEFAVSRTCSFENHGSARQRAETSDRLHRDNGSVCQPSWRHQVTGSKTHISIIQVSYENHAVVSDDGEETNTTKALPCNDGQRPSTTHPLKPLGHVHIVLPEVSATARETEDRETRRSSCVIEEPPREQANFELYPTLKSCLTSPVFVLHVMWTSFNVLRLVAFFGLINSKLSNMFDGDTEKVSFFTNVLAYFMLSMMCVCWISGAVYDWQTAVCRERQSLFEKRVLPGALPLALTSAIGVAISAMALTDSEVVLYFMFACFVFYNAFIFGVCLSFLMRVFPERFFGILNGVLSIVSGSFCFLQYGIFRWHDVNPGGPLHANIFMLSLVAASFLHPLYLVFACLHRQTASLHAR